MTLGDLYSLLVSIDDPARIQAIARKRARATMMSVRQKASEFDQARREANAAAALLEMDGGRYVGGTAAAEELELQTGLKDCQFSSYSRKDQPLTPEHLSGLR